jgi:hypothetical protein
MHVCSSAAAAADGTPEALTIVVQILRSALTTRRAFPDAAIAQRLSSARVSLGVSVAGAAPAIVAWQSARVWARLGVVAGSGSAGAIEEELVDVVSDAEPPPWEPPPWWRERRLRVVDVDVDVVAGAGVDVDVDAVVVGAAVIVELAAALEVPAAVVVAGAAAELELEATPPPQPQTSAQASSAVSVRSFGDAVTTLQSLAPAGPPAPLRTSFGMREPGVPAILKAGLKCGRASLMARPVPPGHRSPLELQRPRASVVPGPADTPDHRDWPAACAAALPGLALEGAEAE